MAVRFSRFHLQASFTRPTDDFHVEIDPSSGTELIRLFDTKSAMKFSPKISASVAQPLPVPDPKTDQVGLGWMGPTIVEKFLSNKNLIWHNGLVGGHASYISFDKVSQTGVIILSNKAMDLHVVGSKLSRLTRIHSVKD